MFFSIDPYELLGNALLFLLVFGMSATVDVKSIRNQITNLKAIFTGLFLQFAVLPLLGFLVVNGLDLDHPMGITLLVVTSSPGGSYSNWWCSIFNADLALSVTMTAISTILSTIMLPLNLLIYAKYTYEDDIIQSLDWESLFRSLVIVILAIGTGITLSAYLKSRKFNKMANKVGNVAGILLVLFSAVMSNSSEDTRLWKREPIFYFSVAFPCILGLIIANIITSCIGLAKPERVTVSIECCYQNVGIATSVALSMFDGDDMSEALGVPVFYGAVEAIGLGIYCLIAWKMNWTKAPSTEPIWKVIFESYEVLLAEKEDLREIEISYSDLGEARDSVTKKGDSMTHYIPFPDDSPLFKNDSKKTPQKKKKVKDVEGATV